MSDDKIIKTYVWHADKCYFVSTIERDSSAMEGPSRYNETIVWEYRWDALEGKDKRGALLHTDGEMTGSIRGHQRIVERIYEEGEFWNQEEPA